MNAKRLVVLLFLLSIGFSLSCLSIEDYANSYPTKMVLKEGQNIEVSLYAFVDGDFKPVKNAIIFVEKYGSKGLESICKANTNSDGKVVVPKDSDESKYYRFMFCYYDPAKECAFRECLSELNINSIDDIKDCVGFSVNKEKATVNGEELRLRPAVISTSTTISRQVGVNVTNLSVCFPLIIALGTIIGVMLMTGNNPFIWFSFDMLRNPRLVRPSNIRAGFEEAGVRRERISTAKKLFMAGRAATMMADRKKKTKVEGKKKKVKGKGENLLFSREGKGRKNLLFSPESKGQNRLLFSPKVIEEATLKRKDSQKGRKEGLSFRRLLGHVGAAINLPSGVGAGIIQKLEGKRLVEKIAELEAKPDKTFKDILKLQGLKLVKNIGEGVILMALSTGFLYAGEKLSGLELLGKKGGEFAFDYSRWAVYHMIETAPGILTNLEWQRVIKELDEKERQEIGKVEEQFIKLVIPAYQLLGNLGFQLTYFQNPYGFNKALFSMGIISFNPPSEAGLDPSLREQAYKQFLEAIKKPILYFGKDGIYFNSSSPDVKQYLPYVKINQQSIPLEGIVRIYTLQTIGKAGKSKFSIDNNTVEILDRAYRGEIKVEETGGTFKFIDENGNKVMEIKVDSQNNKITVKRGGKTYETRYDPVVETSLETLVPEKREEAQELLKLLYLSREDAKDVLGKEYNEAMDEGYFGFIIKKGKGDDNFLKKARERIYKRQTKTVESSAKKMLEIRRKYEKQMARLAEQYGIKELPSNRLVGLLGKNKIRDILIEKYKQGFVVQLLEMGEYNQYFKLADSNLFKLLLPLDAEKSFDAGRWLLSSYILSYLAAETKEEREGLQKYRDQLDKFGVDVESLDKKLDKFKEGRATVYKIMESEMVRETMEKITGKVSYEKVKSLLDYKALPFYSAYVTSISDKNPEKVSTFSDGEILLLTIYKQRWSDFMFDDPFTGLNEKEISDVNKLAKKMEKAKKEERERYQQAFYAYVAERFIIKRMKYLETERINYLRYTKLIDILNQNYETQFNTNKDKSIKQLLSSKRGTERKRIERMRDDLAKLNELLPEGDRFNLYEMKLGEIHKYLVKLKDKYSQRASSIDLQISKLTSVEVEAFSLSEFSHLYVKKGDKAIIGQPVIFRGEDGKFSVIIPGKSEYEEDVLEETEKAFKSGLIHKVASLFKGDPFKNIQGDARRAVELWEKIRKLKESKKRLRKASKSVEEGGSKLIDKKISKLKKEIEEINKKRRALGLKPVDEDFYKKFLTVKKKLVSLKQGEVITKEDVLVLGEVTELPELDGVNPLEKPEEYAQLLSNNRKKRKEILSLLEGEKS